MDVDAEETVDNFESGETTADVHNSETAGDIKYNRGTDNMELLEKGSEADWLTDAASHAFSQRCTDVDSLVLDVTARESDDVAIEALELLRQSADDRDTPRAISIATPRSADQVTVLTVQHLSLRACELVGECFYMQNFN